MLLLTVRLLLAVLPQGKFLPGLLGCIYPGLHGAVLAQNCLQQEKEKTWRLFYLLPHHLPPQLV